MSAIDQIDIVGNTHREITIPDTNSDLEQYLNGLILEIVAKERKREFEFERNSTEFFIALTSFHHSQDFSIDIASENLAKRLLCKEIITDQRYGHLGKENNSIVKKGSFLQFLYHENGSIAYLGVKIDHQEFLDETDFSSKFGLAIREKIYKACKVSYSIDGIPKDVFVYDTNQKLAVYWWNDFLELKEKISDTTNTIIASKAVIQKIGDLKKDHPADFTILRNATVSAFKQNTTMDYIGFIDGTFTHYSPQDQALYEKLPAFVEKLKGLPEKKGFDTHFQLIPSAVPFKRAKYNLTNEITLSYDEAIYQLDQKIWSEQTQSGKKLVVIESSSCFDNFTIKKREL